MKNRLEEFMKKEENNEITVPIKLIGKNCKWNKISTISNVYFNNMRKRKYFYCWINGRQCGQNTTCNCFDDKGKFCFQEKEK